MTRMKLAALVAAASLLVAGLTVANAAHLDVTSGSISTATAGPCTTSTVAVTRTGRLVFFGVWWRGVTFTLPASCHNLPIRMTAVTSTGTSDHEWTSTGTANGTVPFSLTGLFGYYADSTDTFALAVDGWSIATETTN